jgi:hypothetical protein
MVTMKTSIKIKSNVRAGLGGSNHNHNVAKLTVKTKIRSGGLQAHNHNASLAKLAVRTKVRAGTMNHNQNLTRI